MKSSSFLLTLCFLAPFALAEEAVIVVHKQADSVGIYATKNGQLLATIPVGVKPHELVLSKDSKFAYVTNYGVDSYTQMQPGDNRVSIIDLSARTKIADIDLGKYRRPHGIERGASGRLYVTTDFPAAVLILDPQARTVIKAIELEDTLPHMLAVTRDERRAFVACSGSASIASVSLETGQTKSTEVGGVPMGIVLTPDEGRAYVTNRTGEAVAIVDTGRVELLTKVVLKGQPVRLQYSPDRRKVVVTMIGSGDAAVLDALTMQPERRFPAGKSVEGLTFDEKGRFLYLTVQGEDRILKITTDGWRPVLDIKTAARPDTPAVFQLK